MFEALNLHSYSFSFRTIGQLAGSTPANKRRQCENHELIIDGPRSFHELGIIKQLHKVASARVFKKPKTPHLIKTVADWPVNAPKCSKEHVWASNRTSSKDARPP